MKKTMLHIPRLLAVGVFAILIVQCSKKDETPPKTRSELLLGSWMLTALTVNPPVDVGTGTKVSDVFPYYDACSKDDSTIFKVNSEGLVDEGVTKCDPADPQTIPFLWTLKNSDTILSISAQTDFTIVQLDATTLKVTDTFTDTGVTYTETLTFTKK